MIDVILVASRAEEDHLVVSPIREFCLDLGLFLFLIGIHRGATYGIGGRLVMAPRLHSESLSSSAGLFEFPLMIGMRSNLVSRKSRLNVLLGGDLLIQSSASPDIVAVSKILILVALGLTPTQRPHN